MTTQRPLPTAATRRLLRRRTTDRVLGGVAGGLGDYFNIDPLLIRIAFVGLMIFGGAGLVLYVVAWLLIPAEGQATSSVEGFFGRLGLTPNRLAWIAFAVVALILIANIPIGGPLDGAGGVFIGPLPGLNPAALWALAIIVTGIVLLRRRGNPAAVMRAAPYEQPASVEQPQPAMVAAPLRPRSPLAWYVIAATLMTVGVLAISSQLADRSVSPGQFFGAALAVLGIGLVFGAWWGHARILILVALLLVPLGVVGSFITAPLEGGIGDHEYTPVTVAELQTEYRSMGGRITLDLTNLSSGTQTFRIAASVAVGQLVVILPEDASVELRTKVGAGDSIVLGTQEIGTSLDNTYIRHHLYRTTYVLDLQAGIGEVYVRTRAIN